MGLAFAPVLQFPAVFYPNLIQVSQLSREFARRGIPVHGISFQGAINRSHSAASHRSLDAVGIDQHTGFQTVQTIRHAPLSIQMILSILLPVPYFFCVFCGKNKKHTESLRSREEAWHQDVSRTTHLASLF
jgi:hypothetical protein